jgi:hypothetical protein
MAGKSIGTPGSQAGYAVGRDSPPSNPARGSVGAAPGLPGSAGDTGTMGVPGGVQARGTGSPASRGVPGRPGAAPSAAEAPARGSDPGVAGVPGGLAARGGLTGAPVAGPRSDPRDAGVMGVPGGLQARGTSLAQKAAGDFANTAYGKANPAEMAAMMGAAVQRGFSGMLTSPAFSPRQNDFLSKISPAVMEAAVRTGISPSVIGAMAALESAWGTKAPQNNLFGVKATASWKGPTQTFNTKEQVGPNLAPTTGRFRSYSSWRDSIADFANLMGIGRYAGVPGATTAQAQADAIARAGYATDRNYGNKVGGIAGRIGRDR